MSRLQYWQRSALFICSFRPFFVLTAGSAILFMALWLMALQGWLSAWPMHGGWTLWHAHELIFGFAAAATAGFALTAIPEFTRSAFMPAKPLWRMVLVWLLARVAYLLAPWLGIWPAALLNLVFWLLLLWRITPPVWQAPERKHLSFPIAAVALACLQLGFFSAVSLDGAALNWLYAAVHAFMVLIILAASRVSVSVVNNLVESSRSVSDPDAAVYIARPPRRNLAIACIFICALSEFFLGANAVTGWTALAAMAAVLHLLNDWHIGRPLFSRLALMLYASYWMMALGYALLGAAYLGAPLLPSAARHLLMAGSMSLVIFTIMSIVARIHSGLWLDKRLWLPLAGVVLIGAGLARSLAGFYSFLPWFNAGLLVAGLLWIGGFALYAVHFFGILVSPRADGQDGCAEPLAQHTATST